MEEGARVERARPVSEPTQVRAGRTFRCAKPSMVPTARIERAISTYEEDVMPFHYAGEILEPPGRIALP